MKRLRKQSRGVAERIAVGDRVIVPAFWRHEMLNALLMGERRKRLTPELTQAFIEDLQRFLWMSMSMPIRTRFSQVPRRSRRKHRLTAYDAAYLEIAFRENIALPTVNEDLKGAALTDGVLLL